MQSAISEYLIETSAIFEKSWKVSAISEIFPNKYLI